jgi:3-dehydroquinate synthase
MGMVAAAKVANRRRMISQEAVRRIVDLLEKLDLPTEIDRLPSKRIIQSLAIDKKVRAGKVQFVLPERIGRVAIKDNVALKIARQVLKEMGCR